MLKHITIFLPIPYRGGSLRVTKTIARMISKGSQHAGTPCRVRVAVLAGEYDLETVFADLVNDDIEVREFSWRTISRKEVAAIKRNQGESAELDFDQYQIPDDGIDNCIDSDCWLIVSDRLAMPLAPVKPHIVFATDYIQRYIPGIFPKSGWGKIDHSFLQAARLATAVIATTPQTMQDAITYAGVPASKVHLAPMDFDPTWMSVVHSAQEPKRPYIVWPTNPAQHKNHVRAIDALIRYYEELEGALDVKILGPNSRWLDPKFGVNAQVMAIDYVRDLRTKIADSQVIRRHVQFLGELSDDRYAATLSGAAFLWHPTLIDNGTFVVAEAAWCGCPSLASGYPQMRYIGDRFAIPMEFFNASSVQGMANALKYMESKADEIRLRLPSRESLARHSWQNYASEYWDILHRIFA
ncbi:glycosyltransferase family 4 protein [Mesorhizobium sp. B2-5-11]|uniref:glycosyltransferase family 4 protein n=1 Tax=Mesorhizobium sp. B2-5-11 TaxID=2589919 RepID=UPI00112D206A|nr:glycosyltransferase family 4 protein [Mesorhizobium sp. B2-5-11]TPK14176.1 glycosyltransferase family 4 protein [Mesorhizobium sp. B2-5-11]